MNRMLTIAVTAGPLLLVCPPAWASWSGSGSALPANQAAAHTRAVQTTTISTGGGDLKCPGNKKVQIAWTVPTTSGNAAALAGTSYTLLVNGVADPVSIPAGATGATSVNAYSGSATVSIVTNYSLWKRSSTNTPSVTC